MSTQQLSHGNLFPSPAGVNLASLEQNMNFTYPAGNHITNNSLPGQIMYQSPFPSAITPSTTGLPLSPITMASNCQVGTPELNGNLSASHDSNIQYLLQQQQQQLEQYRNLQLQQQQLLQQQQWLQEQLNRLPQSPPVQTQNAGLSMNGWQYPQNEIPNQMISAQNPPYPPSPPHAIAVPPAAIIVPPQQAQTFNHQAIAQTSISAPGPDHTVVIALSGSPDVVDCPKIAAAPPHTYIPNPIDPRQNTLPSSLPTSLNPSLKVKPSFGIEAELANQQPAQSTWDGAKVDVYQDDHNTSGIGSSVTSSLSPTGSSPTSPNFGRIGEYTMAACERPPTKDACLRCLQKVYAMEQIGPIKGVLYHKNCFVCAVCGTRLNLKNFHHNPNDMDDLSVYCASHRPRERAAACNATAVQIKTALKVPKLDKVNEQIRSDQHSPRLGLDKYERKPSIVSATLPTHKEQYFYGMGLQQQQEYCNHQQQLVMEQQQQLLKQHQQTVNLLQQHQEKQEQQQEEKQQQQEKSVSNVAAPVIDVSRSRKSSLMSTGSQTGESLVSTPTKCLDDVFHPPAQSVNKRSGPGSSITPVSSGSSSLSSATGSSMDKRQRANLSAAEGEALANDLDNMLSLHETAGTNKETLTGQGQELAAADSPHMGMRRSDRPSSLEDQSSDRVSISSFTSNTSGGRDSLDGASFNAQLPGQKVSTSSLERADRPSSRSSTSSTSSAQHSRQQSQSYSRQCSVESTGSSGRDSKGSKNARAVVAQEKTSSASGKVFLKSRSEMDFDLQKKDRERNARFLPRNESMRMDRPSQYS